MMNITIVVDEANDAQVLSTIEAKKSSWSETCIAIAMLETLKAELVEDVQERGKNNSDKKRKNDKEETERKKE